ncbi:MAG TPA: DUF4416 family protein [Thermotogota bacterium]|nr:DUF4416 family protein [Thermotogota bacterium]HRW91424.1 DUF4416 family protein [Thermotogota bacterium]
MGDVRKVDLVNLTFFIFARYLEYRFSEIRPVLESIWGKLDFVSPNLDFGKYTFYYSREMGEGVLEGKLLSFQNLVHPGELADIKLQTNRLERKFSVEGKRVINLDPGYIHPTQFVLASTKHWANRIYLRRGIFAEITLMYVHGKFQPLDYTYPNYADPAYIKHLTAIRKLYMEKRKSR